MTSDQPMLSFQRWSELSARAKGLSTEQLMDLLEAEDVALAEYLQAGPVHLAAIVAGLEAGDAALADEHVRRSREKYPDVATPPRSPGRAPAESTAAVSASAPRLASPSYMLAVQTGPSAEPPGGVELTASAGGASAAPTDETRAMPQLSLAELLVPALPFAGAPSAMPRAESVAPTDAPADAGATALLPMGELVIPTAGTFRDRLAPVVVPSMPLGEYAELRARLTVLGEEHEPTLSRFGVARIEVRDALKARFAELFQRDAAAQERFLAEMQAAIRRVRAERDQ